MPKKAAKDSDESSEFSSDDVESDFEDQLE